MTSLDDIYPEDLVIIGHWWPFQAEPMTTLGIVVGDPVTGSAIHRMPMEGRPDECYLRIQVPSVGPPKYELIMTATICGILLTGRGTPHDNARAELAAYEAQKTYVPPSPALDAHIGNTTSSAPDTAPSANKLQDNPGEKQ